MVLPGTLSLPLRLFSFSFSLYDSLLAPSSLLPPSRHHSLTKNTLRLYCPRLSRLRRSILKSHFLWVVWFHLEAAPTFQIPESTGQK